MKSVACLGWYGHGNFGDELILEGLRQLFKDWQLQVYSSDDKGAYPIINFDKVNECDLFVLGGGELINSQFLWMPYPSQLRPHTRLYRLYAHTPWAKSSWISKVKVKKVILGCGVDVADVIDMGENVVADLAQFSYIGLRDKVAVDILQGIPLLHGKVHLFHDLAYAINTDQSTLSYLAKVFPCKLHGLILSHMASYPYLFTPYHRKVKRVQDTIQDLSPSEIKNAQQRSFKQMLEAVV